MGHNQSVNHQSVCLAAKQMWPQSQRDTLIDRQDVINKRQKELKNIVDGKEKRDCLLLLRKKPLRFIHAAVMSWYGVFCQEKGMLRNNSCFQVLHYSFGK